MVNQFKLFLAKIIVFPFALAINLVLLPLELIKNLFDFYDKVFSEYS